MEEFKVTIEKFEGPLDLMLHLIKEKELDLFDLDVNLLTDQYISYLSAMSEMHLEIASEYLVELASLIEYKSHKLLPDDKTELEDEYEEDPKDRLVRRLLEYQRYKEVSQDLELLFEKRQEMFSKPLSEPNDDWLDEELESYDGNPYQLLKAMQRCLRRKQLSVPMEVSMTKKEISVEDRTLELRARLSSLPKTFSFETLLDDCHDVDTFIATFLAVLDLARMQTLVFTVDQDDHIWFSKGMGMS